MHPAVFLDRDGVLNADPGHVHRVEDLVVLPGVATALKKLADAGFVLIVITNQGGIGLGKFTRADADQFNKALVAKIFAESGAKIAGVYLCPHHPKGVVPEFSGSCECRKPGIALVTQAASAHAINLQKSYFIGDRPSDIECGLNAQMTSLQVAGDRTHPRHPKAAAYCDNLSDAVTWIMNAR